MTGLLNIRRRAWKIAVEKPEFIDRRKRKIGVLSNKGKAYEEVYESMNLFFLELQEEVLPFATRIVRDITGLITRDNNPDDILLPPYLSKHKCYARWSMRVDGLHSEKNTANTSYESCYKFKDYPNDDDDKVSPWPQG